uniref:Uncharacterized protein n=1 Tax=Caenorhabditis japonica TaxID=281687 RepID=A0A8R1ED05_CAEJA
MLIYCVKVRTSHVFMFADSYRWLIFVFAATDVFYSLVDMATGMDELLKLLLLCLRCSTIPFCFGILQIHFIYRYILVCKYVRRAGDCLFFKCWSHKVLLISCPSAAH